MDAHAALTLSPAAFIKAAQALPARLFSPARPIFIPRPYCYPFFMTAIAKIPVHMTGAEFFAWTPSPGQMWKLAALRTATGPKSRKP
jgi:hypothetical protein